PERFAREPRDSHGVIRRVTTGGVRKDRIARTIDHREKVLLGAREIDAANRDRDDLRARCLVTSLHDLVRGVLARADEEARAESIALHDELFIEARRRERSERAGLGHGGASPFVRQPERWAGLGVEMRPKRGESKEENDSRNREVEPRTNGLGPESFDRALTAPHERHDLDDIALAKPGLFMRASRDDALIHLDRYGFAVNPELPEKRCDRAGFVETLHLAVENDVDHSSARIQPATHRSASSGAPGDAGQVCPPSG